LDAADKITVTVREELPSDIDAIREVNRLAFGGAEEADVVDRLRRTCPGLLSLVAVLDGQVVGHILFSPATIECQHGLIHGMGLAPIAVRPEYQRRGIGSQLVRAGLDMLRRRVCRFVIVLGHPEYYPRFGFEVAARHGIYSEWDGVPDEAFMILALDASVVEAGGGVARYRSEFDAAM
jgi:putative acetyltransferase